MESQPLLDPETISAIIGGLIVVGATVLARGVAWLKAMVVRTPTKIDDRFYNSLVKAFADAGVIPPEQADKVSVADPKPGGLKVQ